MKTPLYDIHQQLGAKIVDFAGWEMPVQYSSIIEEHQAVRKNAGLFDVSHMGEFMIEGKDALTNIQYLVTNDLCRIGNGKVIYTPMCNKQGCIIDDLLIYRFNEEKFMMVVNASNIEKDFDWISRNIIGDIKLDNISDDTALLALQGPDSGKILSILTKEDLDSINYYCFTEGKIAGINTIISRTGYTGELGYELYCSSGDVEKLWNEIMRVGIEYNVVPAGLGARDTLRLEKKYCLYGNDINSNKHPLEAGLSWTVKFSKGDFIGKESLLKYKEEGYKQRLIGFKLIDRGVARHGYQIVAAETIDDNNRNNSKTKLAVNQRNIIGEVTSGSYSPTLAENIGLAYLDKEYAAINQEIYIIIRDKPVRGVVVETPFV